MVGESTGVDCEHDKNFRRLITIAKIFVVCTLVIGAFIYQQYRFSIETIEVEIFSKNITWIEGCDENHCVEAPQFNIITINERFTTTGKIYDQIEPKATYFLGIKGWAFNGNKRKVVKVY
jgi:hypothetical protein